MNCGLRNENYPNKQKSEVVFCRSYGKKTRETKKTNLKVYLQQRFIAPKEKVHEFPPQKHDENRKDDNLPTFPSGKNFLQLVGKILDSGHKSFLHVFQKCH